MGDNWPMVELGKYVRIQGGYSYKREDFLSHGFGIIKIKNIRHRIIDFSELDYITPQLARETSRYFVNPGDILISMTGSGLHAPNSIVGRVAKYKGPKKTFLQNQRVGRFVIKNLGSLDKEYLFHLLNQYEIQMRLVRGGSGSANQVNISNAQIYKLRIPLPPLPEQHRIAYILGTLDDKIELNRRMNQTLETITGLIFKSWFVDFAPVRAKLDGRDTGLPAEIADLFPDGFEDSELGKIPRGWRVGKIEDICKKIENGGTPKRANKDYWIDGNIPWFKTGELNDGPLITAEELITQAGLDNSSCKLWKKGTILIALYASPTVGRLGVLEVKGTSNQACSGLLANDDYGNQFLYYSLYFSRDQFQNIAVGAAQQNISQQIVKAHKIILPNIHLAKSFQSLVSNYFEKRVQLSRESKALAELRDTLLPKLMRGELRV